MQSFYFKFSEGELRKIELFLHHPESMDVQKRSSSIGRDNGTKTCALITYKGQIVMNKLGVKFFTKHDWFFGSINA